MKKHSVMLTYDEIDMLQHILRHFADYVFLDDRPDHGLGILSGYRKVTDEKKVAIAQLSGKFWRKKWGLYDKREKERELSTQ